MTLCAAQQENKELQFSQFCDVIEFNPEEDVFYFPSLFEGQPPMTSIAPGYIEKAQELKTKIIKHNATQDTRFQSVREWKKKLSDLWNSVLKENFVFSYRNILEVNARVELDGAMCCWYSNFIQAMTAVKSEFINKLYNVEFEFLQDTLQDITTDLIRIVKEYSESEKLIDYFFVQHEKKAIFAQWKCNTEQYFQCCKKKELERIQEECKIIYNVEKQKQIMDNKFSLCQRELFIEVRRLFSAYNDKSSFDKSGSPNNLFDTVWRDWKSSFQCVPIDTTDISNDLQEVLFKYSKLKQLDVFNMKQGLILDSTKFKLVGRVEFDELYTTLSIPQTHENSYYKIVDYQQRSILFVFLNINNQISNANQQRLQSIQTDHTLIIDSIIRKFPKNGNYSIDYFSFLIDKCISLITEHNTTEKSTNARQAILFTNHYIFDFTFYQCCRAITTFEELQDRFIEQNSLEFKLGSLESSMREIFSQICSGIKSENLCASKLSSIIFSGIRMYLKDTLLQLLQRLFVNDPKHDSTYSNRGFLHLYILKDLAKKKVFEDYILYINSPFRYINSFILKNIREYSKEETVITNILFTLNQTTQDLKTHCIDAANSVSRNIDSWDEWKQHFHESIIKFVRSVKLSDLDILDMYDVENYEQFSDLFAKTLEDSIKTFNWRAWISKVLTLDIFYELQEIIASSLVECRALCPFCKEPCQLSAGEHEHYCGTFHRPQGISGWHFINSRKIDVDECTTSIRCNHTFLFEEKLYNYPNYRTVNEYFKSWKILADDSIVSKYWQWVLYTFQKEFVAYYEILGNEQIDNRWSNLSEEEIIKDIKNHYTNSIFPAL